MATTQRPVSGWAVGWTVFAAVLLMLAGVFQFFAGLTALLGDDILVVGEEYVFQFDLTTWGWIHVAVAVVLFLTGLGLFAGNTLARVIGVIVAALAMIVNFAWLPWYPIWGVIMIAVSAAVIWALTVHGRDVATAVSEERQQSYEYR